MKIQDILNCAFPQWYETYKHITEESIILPLPTDIIDYLHADGLVLPESSTHGIYPKSSNLAMDGDEDDAEIRDDELMNMYEADWSVPSINSQEVKAPDVSKFDTVLKEAIASLGGRVFPKLNWSAPKDATWISFDRTLMCTCPSDVYLLLKSSQFITHDLDSPFSHCDVDNSAKGEDNSVSYSLVLRKWNPPTPASEFRCFVKDKQVIGICQRNVEKFYPSIKEEKDPIVKDILHFYTQHLQESFPSHNYVFDVIRLQKNVIRLVDFNPWGTVTDGLMFDWKHLDDYSSLELDEKVPEFRYVMSEDGVKSSSYSQYAVPLDIVQLEDGMDAVKMMQRLATETGNLGEDSSSEEDS